MDVSLIIFFCSCLGHRNQNFFNGIEKKVFSSKGVPLKRCAVQLSRCELPAKKMKANPPEPIDKMPSNVDFSTEHSSANEATDTNAYTMDHNQSLACEELPVVTFTSTSVATVNEADTTVIEADTTVGEAGPEPVPVDFAKSNNEMNMEYQAEVLDMDNRMNVAQKRHAPPPERMPLAEVLNMDIRMSEAQKRHAPPPERTPLAKRTRHGRAKAAENAENAVKGTKK